MELKDKNKIEPGVIKIISFKSFHLQKSFEFYEKKKQKKTLPFQTKEINIPAR